MVKNKIHPLNMAMQAGKIKSIFPACSLSYNQNELTWKHTITPSPLSAQYEIKISYIRGENPNVYVVNPKLELYPGEVKLPHVYNTSKQWLCIYYRKASEWRSDMYIADTVIPWTSEWLLHYECWLATGIWHGGGIHHESEEKKQANKQKNR